jgi:hypothetical protein
MTFDVKKHVIKVQGGKEYLPVAWRLVWFREEHPDWRILTNAVDINLEQHFAIFQASIMNEQGEIIGMGTKHENAKGFADFIEKAETGAIGRALAVCGYGTQFEPELDEAERLADSPQEQKQEALKCVGCGKPAHPKSVEHFGEPLCIECGKKRKDQPADKPNGERKAKDPVMARLAILCDEYFKPNGNATAEQMLRAWFGAEYGVEHRTELTDEQKRDAISKLDKLVAEHRGGTK